MTSSADSASTAVVRDAAESCFRCNASEQDVNLFYFTCPSCAGPAAAGPAESVGGYHYTWQQQQSRPIWQHLEQYQRSHLEQYQRAIANPIRVLDQFSTVIDVVPVDWLPEDRFALYVHDVVSPFVVEGHGFGRYLVCDTCKLQACPYCNRQPTPDDYVRFGYDDAERGPEHRSSGSGGTGASGDAAHSHTAVGSQGSDLRRQLEVISDKLANVTGQVEMLTRKTTTQASSSTSKPTHMMNHVKVSFQFPNKPANRPIWLPRTMTISAGCNAARIEEGCLCIYDGAEVLSDTLLEEISGPDNSGVLLIRVEPSHTGGCAQRVPAARFDALGMAPDG